MLRISTSYPGEPPEQHTEANAQALAACTCSYCEYPIAKGESVHVHTDNSIECSACLENQS